MLKVVCAISALFIFAACGDEGGNAGVHYDGRCTQATVDAYNDIHSSASDYDNFKSRSALKDVQSACIRFKSLMGGQSCRATQRSTGFDTYVSKSDVSGICDKADDILARTLTDD